MTQWQQHDDDVLDYAPDTQPWRPIGYSLQGLAYLRHQMIYNLSIRFPREQRAAWEFQAEHRSLLLVKAETGRR